MPEVTDEQIARARKFHETYERLAPDFGYETRPDTKHFDPESHNGQLMIAVMGEIAQSETSSAARDAGWCSLEEWPRSADEFTGSYWSGIALLEPTENSCSLAAYLDFITYDAGVATWWASSEDGEDLHDIDPSKIIALYYLPNPPDRFNEREEAVKKALRERFPKRWYGAGNPFHKE